MLDCLCRPNGSFRAQVRGLIKLAQGLICPKFGTDNTRSTGNLDDTFTSSYQERRVGIPLVDLTRLTIMHVPNQDLDFQCHM